MKNILVIGEAAKDIFNYVSCNRLSPEGPWPVLIPENKTENPGMAANVVANLKSLKGDYNLNVHFLRPFTTILKTRFVDSKTFHHFFRLDDYDTIPEEEVLYSREQLINYCNSFGINFQKLDAVVFSSYKNFLTKGFIYDAVQMAKLYNIPVFLDCKFDLGEWSKDIFCVKINEKELEYNISNNVFNPEKFCNNFVVTLGERGAEWKNYSKGILENFDTKEKVKNPFFSGAGDSNLAGLVIKYLETKDLKTSIQFGVDAATFKCTQKGIIAVKRGDLEEWIKN